MHNRGKTEMPSGTNARKEKYRKRNGEFFDSTKVKVSTVSENTILVAIISGINDAHQLEMKKT